ncbi:MAG TPA: T9SS type A sorting domain-containing protein [Chitinophagales bacterium]|nr:T9SS type A sorting domain-containing protein [Chitinophagales bacterium]
MKKLFTVIICIALFNATKAQQITLHNPEIIPVTLESISLPLSQLPESPPTPEELNGPRVEKDNPSLEHPIPVTNPNALPKGADPARQTDYTASTTRGTTATVLSNWAGITAAVDPSDNTIAVGPGHVMQMANNSSSTYIRIWNKSGTLLVNNKKVQSITNINDYGDPNIIYDPQADRYVMCVLYSFSASKLVVCITQTNDPTGSWYVYSFKTKGGYPDYPKLAVWGNSYFITTNSNSPTVYAINRSKLLTGAAIGTVQKFTMSAFGTISFQAPTPVTETGATAPPTTEPETIMRVADDGWNGVATDHLELFKVTIDWITPANSTMTGPTNLTTISYNSNLCSYNSYSCIPQKSSNVKLDPLSHIIMDKVQYYKFSDHEAIVCSHVCNADGNGTAGIRWYELRTDASGNWYIYQQSTYQPDNTHRFMSTVTVNGDGAIALGYNVSSTSVYTGQGFTGRASADASNSMTITENIPQAGSHANGSTRYGDYNGIVTDPSDNSFWYTANYNPTSSWSTNVCHFTITHNFFRDAPSNIVVNNIKMHSVELSWTGAQTPVYDVRYREAGTLDWISSGKTSLADYVVAGLAPDTKYEFSLVGEVNNDVLYSEIASATTLKADVQQESMTTTSEISIAPVPATDNVQISFTSPVTSNTQIQIFSLNGQLALTQSLYAFEGINITNTDVQSLKNGTYIVRVTTKQGVMVKKMVIQK